MAGRETQVGRMENLQQHLLGRVWAGQADANVVPNPGKLQIFFYGTSMVDCVDQARVRNEATRENPNQELRYKK